MRIAAILLTLSATAGAADLDLKRIEDPSLFAILSSVEASARTLSITGFSHSEAAAFIVDAGDHIECMMWPQKYGYHDARYDGKIPEQTIAIVHSHPDSFVNPGPSRHDIEASGHLRLPMYVVARFSAYLIDPNSGEITTLGDEIKWPIHSASVCKELQLTVPRPR